MAGLLRAVSSGGESVALLAHVRIPRTRDGEAPAEPIVDGRVVVPGEVSGPRPFDLDHACSEVGQMAVA